MERWDDQQIANKMAVSPCNDKLAFLDSQEAERLANRVASFTDQEMVNGVPAGIVPALRRISSLGNASVIQWKKPADSEVARTVDIPGNRCAVGSFFFVRRG